jgi:hypothetical protein
LRRKCSSSVGDNIRAEEGEGERERDSRGVGGGERELGHPQFHGERVEAAAVLDATHCETHLLGRAREREKFEHNLQSLRQHHLSLSLSLSFFFSLSLSHSLSFSHS